MNQKMCTPAKCGKTYNRCQARENLQLATNDGQERENMKHMLTAGKDAICVGALGNLQQVPNIGKFSIAPQLSLVTRVI